MDTFYKIFSFVGVVGSFIILALALGWGLVLAFERLFDYLDRDK